MLELIPDSSSVARASYDEKVDVFSMAVVFWEVMHSGKNIFPDEWSISDILLAVRHGYRPTIEPGILDQFPEIVGLITQMWAREPHNRPSSKRVLAFLEEYQLAVLRDIISHSIRPPHSCNEFADMLMARAIMTRRLEALKVAQFAVDHGLLLNGIPE
jgi:serine/threonine protein kinase